MHAQVNFGYHQSMLNLTSALLLVLPNALLCVQQLGGVENAVRLARYTTGKIKMAAFQCGCHGRTISHLERTSV